MYELLAEKALSSLDKILEMGLIKMDEKWKTEFYKKKTALRNERAKLKHERDYRMIYDLENDLVLLMEIFEKQIEEGRIK